MPSRQSEQGGSGQDAAPGGIISKEKQLSGNPQGAALCPEVQRGTGGGWRCVFMETGGELASAIGKKTYLST